MAPQKKESTQLDVIRNIVVKILNYGIIFLSVFALGWYFGRRGFVPNFSQTGFPIKIINASPNNQAPPADFNLFWQVWDKVTSASLFRPLNGDTLVLGAIKGMVDSVGDPYTIFLTPEEKTSLDDGLSGKYEGVGIELGLRDNQLIIVAPLDGSPAREAGVVPGDKILAIDGQSTAGLTIFAAVALIRGESSTFVNLYLQTGDNPPRELQLQRRTISSPSISWEQKENGIVYIKISRFGTTTLKEWSDMADQFKNIGLSPSGIVLDLRSNPGGYMDGAIRIASSFIGSGKVVLTEDRGSSLRKEYKSEGFDSVFSNSRLAILINKGSASSAEILAAALVHYRKAVLVGETTFGKGTIQESVPVSTNMALNITIARWLTPEGVWVDEKGLVPDYPVEITEEESLAGIDSQLDKALEIVRDK